jgi:hypothetical protein
MLRSISEGKPPPLQQFARRRRSSVPWRSVLLVIGCACRTSAPPPAATGGAPDASEKVPPANRPAAPLSRGTVSEPRLAALLDISSEREAALVAIVGSQGWQAADLVGQGAIDRLSARGLSFQRISPATDPPAAGATSDGTGTLAGGARTHCGDYYLPLARPAAVHGFAVVLAGGSEKDRAALTAPRLQPVKALPAQVAAVAALIKRTIKRNVTATIEHAYRLDLDGNGTPELLLQATHPDLNGDPAKLKPGYYSLIVVLHDGDVSAPAFVGYLQGAKDFADFEVLTLDSAADIDLDGKAELLVRARHNEGWQTQVFRYDAGRLIELFRSVGGEGECPDEKE